MKTIKFIGIIGIIGGIIGIILAAISFYHLKIFGSSKSGSYDKEDFKIKGPPKDRQIVPDGKITEEEWNQAIDCLLKNVPEKTFFEVWELMQKEGESWEARQKGGDSWAGIRHHGFGTYIRNTLRKCGIEWGPIGLDDNWDLVMEDATRKFMSSRKK